MKIYVRFGHMRLANGSQTGASGLITERTFIEAVAPHVANALYRSNKHTVRTADPQAGKYATDLDSVNAMLQEAKDWGADLFVSIHANASGDSSVSGSEVLYNVNTTLSKSIATTISSDVSKLLGISNRGIRPSNQPPYDANEVALAGKMHSVIVEPIFITCKKDVDAYKAIGAEKLGNSIAVAILKNI